MRWLDVGEEALPRLLAVVADVDAGGHLAGDDVGGRRLDRRAQLGRVDGLAAAAPAVQRGQRGGPGQAAGVGDDEARLGGQHPAARRQTSRVCGTLVSSPLVAQLVDRRHRVGIAEQAVVAVVGRRGRWRRASTTTPRGRCRSDR